MSEKNPQTEEEAENRKTIQPRTKQRNRRDWWPCPVQGVEYCMEPIPLDELHKYDGNPRDLDMSHAEELAQEIKEDGQMKPIVVVERTDGDYNIISGNHRYEALKILRDQGYEGYDGVGFHHAQAKIYSENLSEDVQWKFGSKYNEPPKKMNYTERGDNVVRSRERAREEFVQKNNREPNERELLKAAEVDMDDEREKREFVVYPIINEIVDRRNDISQFLCDDGKGKPWLVKEGETKKTLSTRQLSLFLKHFVWYHVVDDDAPHRSNEEDNVDRLCSLLANEAIEPLFGQHCQKPNGNNVQNGQVVVFTSEQVIDVFGKLLSGNTQIFNDDWRPLYTDDPSDIDWDELRDWIRKIPTIDWCAPRWNTNSREELRKEMKDEFY